MTTLWISLQDTMKRQSYRLLYLYRLFTLRKRRYQNLLRMTYRLRPRSILEIGVYKGKHAQFVIETAKIFRSPDQIDYYGFDLFESQSHGDLVREFAKKPPSMDQVQTRLERTKANINLFKGYSRDTLPIFVKHCHETNKAVDLVFIDGGHSFETIETDWQYASELVAEGGIIIFDDFLSNTEEEVAGVGCQDLVSRLDPRRYSVQLLEPEDRYVNAWGTLRTRMVAVRIKERESSTRSPTAESLLAAARPLT
jgi:Methyltransferase domain